MVCIGEEVRKLRTEKNLTQEEFAVRVQMSQSKVGRIESDKQPIDLETVIKIAEELNDFTIVIKWHERVVNAVIKSIIHFKNKVSK